MISFVKGTVAAKGASYVIMDVGGIGLKILTPSRDAEGAKIGTEAVFNTYFCVREDAMELYGFSGAEELSMFNLLIGVNGVGPKAAISILSSFTASDISSAVMLSDAKKLSSAQGIGAKTAQRIILELRDKVSTILSEGDEATYQSEEDFGPEAEAISALTALGYSPQEAAQAVKKAGKKDSLEATIKAALLALMR